MASLVSRSVVLASLSAIAVLLGGCGGGGGGDGDKCEANPLKPKISALPIKIPTVTMGFEGLDDDCCSSVKSGINSVGDCLAAGDITANETQQCVEKASMENAQKMECVGKLSTVTVIATIKKAAAMEKLVPALRNLHEPLAFIQDFIVQQGTNTGNASAVMYAEPTNQPKVGATCSPKEVTLPGKGTGELTIDGISQGCCDTATSTANKVIDACAATPTPDPDCAKKACDKDCMSKLQLACIGDVNDEQVTVSLKLTKQSKVQQPMSVDSKPVDKVVV